MINKVLCWLVCVFVSISVSAQNASPDIGNLQGLAEQGSADAQFQLGVAYVNGQNVTRDYAESVKWYALAAKQGHASAQNNLGVAYKLGRGVPRDFVEAFKWFGMSAEKNNSAAQYNLGFAFEKGQGVAINLQEAVQWYLLSANQGYAMAQNALGVMYMNGSGVAQNRQEAVEWFKKAADKGNASATANLKMAEKVFVKTVKVMIPAVIDGKDFKLEGMLYIPQLDGRLPALVMTSGRNGTAPQNTNKGFINSGYEANLALAQRGMVVLNLVRRGYGDSDGPDTELKESAEDTGREMAKDFAAGVRYLQTLGQVDGRRIVLAGQSQGGWGAAVASAVPIDGVVATISFAAAVVTSEGDGRDSRRRKMSSDLKKIGKEAVVPCLFVYAENDKFTTGEDARLFYSSFRDAGGKGRLALYPPVNGEGHFIITSNVETWMPDVDSFLSSVGIALRSHDRTAHQ